MCRPWACRGLWPVPSPPEVVTASPGGFFGCRPSSWVCNSRASGPLAASPPTPHGAAALRVVVRRRGCPRGSIPSRKGRYGASHPDSTPPSAAEPNPQDMSLSLSLPAHDGRDPSLRVTALPRDHVKCAQAVVQAPTEAPRSPDKEDKETPWGTHHTRQNYLCRRLQLTTYYSYLPTNYCLRLPTTYYDLASTAYYY